MKIILFGVNEKSFSRITESDQPEKTHGGGRLTERLIAQGLLTPAMLQELKQEWEVNENYYLIFFIKFQIIITYWY